MPEPIPHRIIVAYVKDLIFSTKIRSTAQTIGKDIVIVQSTFAFKTELQKTPASLAIIDLDAGRDALEALAEALAALPNDRVVAFVSHIHQETIEAAKSLGAQRVMPRSRFSSELPNILGQP
ncbi:MAG: hypothetical protein HY287_12005 [Planctomycetes bacterium]|nr:hypothetical protein [Planctomycetota bacterium]